MNKRQYERAGRIFNRNRTALDWIEYVHPRMKPPVYHVKREVAARVAEALRVGGRDRGGPFDALHVLASYAESQAVPRLRSLGDISQIEAHLTAPITVTLHVALVAGEVWISDRELFPYF